MIGEYRFLGLYTQAAYTESVTRIPVLRRKVDRVLDARRGARGQPRRQGPDRDPRGLPARGAVRDQRRAARPDRRWPCSASPSASRCACSCAPTPTAATSPAWSTCPRDRYTTQVRLRVQEILRSAFGGDSVDYSAMVGNSALARLHVVVHAAPGRPLAEVDQAALQARIAAAVRSWDEDLAAEARAPARPRARGRAAARCADSIPETYKADITPVQAVGGPGGGAAAAGGVRPVRHPPFDSPNGPWRLRLFRLSPITLSDVLPQLQHMGLEVLDEHPYEFARQRPPFWIYDFGLRGPGAGSSPRPRSTAACTGFESALGSRSGAARPRTTTSTAWCSTPG